MKIQEVQEIVQNLLVDCVLFPWPPCDDIVCLREGYCDGQGDSCRG